MRQYTLATDHKLFTTILGPKQSVPSLAVVLDIVIDWIFLHYQICTYSAHGNANGLSRLERRDAIAVENLPDAANFNIAQIDCLPVSVSELKLATHKDPILSKVLYYTRTGLSEESGDSLKSYWNCHLELFIEGNVILWGVRVVIPLVFHQGVMEEFHQWHPGVAQMKTLAYSHF